MQAKDVKDSHISLNLTQNWTRRKTMLKNRLVLMSKVKAKKKLFLRLMGKK